MVGSDDLSDNDLIAQGWKRRSILDGSRLEEVVKMYRDLGFEVMVTEFDPDEVKDSDSCLECAISSLKVVYTRKR